MAKRHELMGEALQAARGVGQRPWARAVRALVGGGLMALVATGCGPQGLEPTGAEALRTHQDAQAHANGLHLNGLIANGLIANGLIANGLIANGLIANGLIANGLNTQAFADWFTADPFIANEIMYYVVSCAVPEGQTRSYTHGGTPYTWAGHMGLAPAWSNGSAASEDEQQLLSACLAARVNKFGASVMISITGQDVANNPLPYTQAELDEYSVKEACFFGNLFAGEWMKVGNDGLSLTSGLSSLRVCSQGSGAASECEVMEYAGSCASHCVKAPGTDFYTHCTFGNKTYRALTTRMRPADVATCGDSVCHAAEAYGAPRHCAADCGSGQ